MLLLFKKNTTVPLLETRYYVGFATSSESELRKTAENRTFELLFTELETARRIRNGYETCKPPQPATIYAVTRYESGSKSVVAVA